jgi:hypothetical protein
MTPKTMNTPFEDSFMELVGGGYENAIARDARVIGAPHEVEDPAAFMLGGKAYFTLRSTKTGTRFTYRVAAADNGGWFVSLLNGPDNWANYQYMGLIGGRDRRFRLTAKSKMGADASSVRAFEWTWQRLSAGRPIDGVEVWHEGKCGRCGRKLTAPGSIESGFGPECLGKLGEGGM